MASGFTINGKKVSAEEYKAFTSLFPDLKFKKSITENDLVRQLDKNRDHYITVEDFTEGLTIENADEREQLLERFYIQFKRYDFKKVDFDNIHLRFAQFFTTTPVKLGEGKDIDYAFYANHFDLFLKLSDKTKREIWRHVAEKAGWGRETFYVYSYSNLSYYGNYDDFEAVLRRENIDFPERFTSLKTLLQVLHNRQRSDPFLETVLVIATKSDWNGGFKSMPIFSALSDSKEIQLQYYEATSNIDIAETMREVTQDFNTPVHTLVLAGHGTQEQIEFGNYHADVKPKKSLGLFGNTFGTSSSQAVVEKRDMFPKSSNSLSLEDFKKQPLAVAFKYGVRSQVLLDSCSTGQGGEGAKNMANTIAAFLPRGARVIAPQRPSNIESIYFDPNTAELNVTFLNNKDYYEVIVEEDGTTRTITHSNAIEWLNATQISWDFSTNRLLVKSSFENDVFRSDFLHLAFGASIQSDGSRHAAIGFVSPKLYMNDFTLKPEFGGGVQLHSGQFTPVIHAGLSVFKNIQGTVINAGGTANLQASFRGPQPDLHPFIGAQIFFDL